MYAQLSLIIISLHLFLLPKYHAQLDYEKMYSECNRTLDCGKNVKEIGYPFWGGDRPEDCGLPGLKLSCENEEGEEFAMLDMGSGEKFRVQYINMSSHEIKMERAYDVSNDTCPQEFEIRANFNETLFDYVGDTEDLHVFYDCPPGINAPVLNSIRNNFTCTMSTSGSKTVGFFGNETLLLQFPNLQDCKIKVRVPVNRTVLEEFQSNVTMELQELLNPSFVVFYKINEVACSACANSGGLCWSGIDSSAGLLCLCSDGAYPDGCLTEMSAAVVGTRDDYDKIDGGVRSNFGKKIGIGIAAAILGILCTCAIVRFFEEKRITNEDKKFEDCITEFGSSIPKRYRYSDVKKLTTSFKDEIGKGGFGSVYKGILSDNRLVAVKLLNSSKGTGEDFINEVASIGRTSHVNVVALLGFCYEGKKRALIYEFMPNGSLDTFIYRENQLTTEPTLGWKNLYDITLGIARGLEYLHRGCSTRILHLDIKPNNILLDEEFCPKISDFGLAKVYSGKESIVSVKGGRGTFGYAAPEVGNRNFGGVSHKSDVYSYGVVVLEMVGGRKNLDIKMIDDNPSQIYFLEWIYKRVELDEDLSLHGEMTVEETEVAKKMIIVAFWCLQQNPSQRPSMNKVIEMLEGNLEALQLPPKP